MTTSHFTSQVQNDAAIFPGHPTNRSSPLPWKSWAGHPSTHMDLSFLVSYTCKRIIQSWPCPNTNSRRATTTPAILNGKALRQRNTFSRSLRLNETSTHPSHMAHVLEMMRDQGQGDRQSYMHLYCILANDIIYNHSNQRLLLNFKPSCLPVFEALSPRKHMSAKTTTTYGAPASLRFGGNSINAQLKKTDACG